MSRNEFIIAWRKALRSKKYSQGKCRLYCKDDDTYCCLGVGVIVLGEKKENIQRYAYPAWGNPISNIFNSFVPKDIQKILARKNDAGMTFSEISKLITKLMNDLKKKEKRIAKTLKISKYE